MHHSIDNTNGASEKYDKLVLHHKPVQKRPKTPENVVAASRSQKCPKIFQRGTRGANFEGDVRPRRGRDAAAAVPGGRGSRRGRGHCLRLSRKTL